MKKIVSLFLILTVLIVGSGLGFAFDKDEYYLSVTGKITGLDEVKINGMVKTFNEAYSKIFENGSKEVDLSKVNQVDMSRTGIGYTEDKWDIKYSPISNLYIITLSYRFNPDPINTKEYGGGIQTEGMTSNFFFDNLMLENDEKIQLNKKIEEEYKKLKSEIHPLESPIQKAIKIMHHFAYVKYDLDAKIGTKGVNNLYTALMNGKTQCNGFSVLMETFLEKFDVESDVIAGNVNQVDETIEYGNDNYAHIWNLVQLGQKWYHLDSTWYYTYVEALYGPEVYSTETLPNPTEKYDAHNLVFASNKQIKDYQIADDVGRYFLLDKKVNPAEDETLPYSFDEYNTVWYSLKLQEVYDKMYSAELGEVTQLEIETLLKDADYLAEKDMISKDMKKQLLKEIKGMQTLRKKLNCSPEEVFSPAATDFSAYDMTYFK